MSRPGAPSDELSRRAFTLLDAASHLEPAAAKEAVRASCSGDPALLAEAMSILGAAERSATPVDRPIFPDLGQHLTVVFESAKTEDPMPARIGPYRIEGELGRGGSAVVLRAVQDGPGRAVALKILMRLPARDAMRRFRAEVAALARLSHPGIAAIHDAGKHDFPWGSSPWIAMELVPGKPITTYAKESGLNWRQAVLLAASACEAVAHAHLRGVMHLDLKPGNILVMAPEAAGGQPLVKILDFGLARFEKPPIDESISLGGPVGTVAYASPEQLTRREGGDGEIDVRADVYALGIILHELIRGGPLFDPARDGMADVIRAITSGRLPPLTRADGGRVPPELAAVVQRATSMRRELRYRSAAELGDDLSRLLSGEPVNARPLGLAYRARCLIRTRPALASSLLVGVIGLVAAVGGTTYGMLEASARERLHRDQRDALLQVIAQWDALGDLRADDDRFPEARAWRVTIMDLLRGMAAAEPRDLHLTANLSIAIVKVGDLDLKEKKFDDAHARYTEALALDERLHAQRPRDRRFADNLVRSYTRLAWLELASKDLDAAAGWAAQAATSAEGLLRLAPDNSLSAHACIETNVICADVMRERGDAAAAARFASRAWDHAVAMSERWTMSGHLASMHCLALRTLASCRTVPDARFAELARGSMPLLRDALRADPVHVELAAQVCALQEDLAVRAAAGGEREFAAGCAKAAAGVALGLWQAHWSGGEDEVAASEAVTARVGSVLEKGRALLWHFANDGNPASDRLRAMLAARNPVCTPEHLADALAAASRAAEATDPHNPASWLVLGECHLALGDLDAAEAAVHHAATIGPGTEEFCLSPDVLRRGIAARRSVVR